MPGPWEKYGSTPQKAAPPKPAPKPKTRAEQIREAGRSAAAEYGGENFLGSVSSGIRQGAFGIPQYLDAGINYAFNNKGGNTFQDVLGVVRARDEALMKRSLGGRISGNLIGGVASGGVAAKGLGMLASRGAAAASSLVARAGTRLQNLMTLRKGQVAANIGKLVTTGAAAGAAQGAGDGTGAARGAVTGAIAAPVVSGGIKLAQVLSRPARDFLRTSSAGRILSRFTSSSADEITVRAAAHRQATGAEPTVFELLPLVDRNKILKQGIVGRDNIVERASTAIRERAGNLGTEMSSLATRTTGPQRRFISQNVNTDLTRARGGTPDPADPVLVGRATNSPTDMLELRDVEARAIMAPHEAAPIADDFAELFPQNPQNINGTIIMADSDPAVTAVIRSAVPPGFRPPGQGVTAGDISDMISTLRGDLGKGGIEARIAQRAIDHLTGVLDDKAPDAGVAARQMTDAYAARSRMAEGMQEGGWTRLRDDVEVGTSRRQARTVRNAYDTPEGAAGRALGQSNRILGDLGGSPEDALKATVKMARGTTGRALAQNLGRDEAGALIAGARAQDASAQALSSAAKTATGGDSGALDAEEMVTALIGLNPSSFATTKAGAIRKLLDMTYVPESRGRVMVDMLFSQDPTMTKRAIDAIGNSPNGAKFMQYMAGIAGQRGAGVVGGTSSGEPVESVAEITEEIPVEQQSEPGPWDDYGEDGIDPDIPYGRQIVEQIFPGAEITEDVRDTNSALGRSNPDSHHVATQNAVDVRPIPGMSFDEFIAAIQENGYEVIEAIDEVNNPSKHATGPHWHVVLA